MKHAALLGVLCGFALIGLLKHCTIEQPMPVPVSHMQVFKDLRSAEMYAAGRAVRCSAYYECGGDIFLTSHGEFVVGVTHSNYSGDELDSQDYKIPEGWKAAADFHTHACLSRTHATGKFSDADVNGNESEDIEGVMVDLCTGDIHLFVPGKTPIGAKVSFEVHDTPGEVIGHIAVEGTLLEPDQGY